MGGALLTHAALLTFLMAAGPGSRRLSSPELGALLRAVTALGAMFFLYSSLGQVSFTAIPWEGDGWVRSWDRALFFGVEPVAWVADSLASRAWATEPLAFFYGAFVPYVYLTIFLGLMGWRARARGIFVLAFVLLYGASFMGYLFVPARGPVVAMTDVISEPLQGGFFLAVVIQAVEAVGGPHGAFPSLHVGVSCLITLFDLRHGNPLRGLIYVPLVLFICVATVALRYHYVVDLLAGATLALAALLLAERLAARWAPRGDAALGRGSST